MESVLSSFPLREKIGQNGLSFLEGVVSATSLDSNFYLVTPNGVILHLNPFTNRQNLMHLNNQAVRVILRSPFWPRRMSQHPLYDVLAIERLHEPPDFTMLEEAVPFLTEDGFDFEDRWQHGPLNRTTEHPDYQVSITY